MVPPMIFLELSKYGKKHMIPPMIFDKTNQQYNIFMWYSLKNIQINFSKCLKIHMVPSMILSKSTKMFEKSYGTPYDFMKKHQNVGKIIWYPL